MTDAGTDPTPTNRAVAVRITGRVQGVGYRMWTRGRARELGVHGWVRNEPDLSVRAHLHGDVEAVNDLIAAMHDGPAWAEVGDVEVVDITGEAPVADGFAIRH